MKTLQTTIAELALRIVPYYIYGTPYYINTQTDRMRARGQMPACLHIQTSDGSFTLTDGNYFQSRKDTHRVQVGFADAVKFDRDPETTIAKVDDLLNKGFQLVKALSDRGPWTVDEAITYEVLYDTQDGNLVWVLLTFNVTDVVGKCVAP